MKQVKASMSLKLQKNLSGSVFGRVNSLQHLDECDKSLDIEVVRNRQFPVFVSSLGDFAGPTYTTLTRFDDRACQSCHAHTIEYREDENVDPTFVPAAFSVRENVKSHVELGSLADEIHECVKSAFGKPDFSKDDTLRHLSGDLLITAHKSNRLAGFSTSSYGSPREILKIDSLTREEGVYLAAGAVAKDSQKEGIYQAMLLQRVYAGLDMGMSLVYTRTQNPKVEEAIINSFKILKKSGDVEDCTLERVRLPGFYGEMLTGNTQTTKDRGIQQVYDHLDLRAGDAYVLIFRIMKGKK